MGLNRVMRFDTVIFVDASVDVTGHWSRPANPQSSTASWRGKSPPKPSLMDPILVRTATPAPTFNTVFNERRFLCVRSGGLPRKVGL